MTRVVLTAALCLTLGPGVAGAQTSDGGFAEALSSSMASVVQAMHRTIRRNLVEAAEAMPAGDYGFTPTPQVRSFSQLIGHVVNANFLFCSQARGEAMPSAVNHETLTSKA